MRRRSSRVAISAVLFVLGLLVVAQLRAQSFDAGLAGLSVAELTELVANVTTRNNQLQREVQALERQRETLASTVERGDNSVGQIRADLNRILAWSGVMGVRGEGVTVTVDGSVPGETIELLLNELRNAGAEAISIGAIRIVPGVVVTGPAGSMVVNGIPLSEPVNIHAIGHPQTLAGSLSRAGGPIARLSARFPETLITVTAEESIAVPATDQDLNPVLGRPRL